MGERITCSRARDMIEELLDDRLDEADRETLDAHVLGCSDCEAHRHGARQVRDLLASQPLIFPSEARIARMWNAIEPRLDEPVVRPKPRLSRPRWLAAAVAAAVLAGWGVGWGLTRLGSQTSPSVPIASPLRASTDEAPPSKTPEPAAISPSVAEVTAAQGAIHLWRGQREIQLDLNQGASLRAGDRLVTGDQATATLRLVEGAEVHLGSSSALTVRAQTSEGLLVELIEGWVLCQVTHDLAPPPLRVRARDTTVRVTGTIFAVEIADDEVEIRVGRGRVEVSSEGRSPVVLIGEQVGTFPEGIVSRRDEAMATRDTALLRGELIPRSTAAAPDLDALFDQAEAARRQGQHAQAVALYRRVVSADPSGSTGGTALITLGQISRRPLGRFAEAQRAFSTYLERFPSGPLRETAYSEMIKAAQARGRVAAARAAARGYLREFPEGIFRDDAEAALEGSADH